MAQGSLTELRNQIIVAKDVKYIDNKKYDILVLQMDLSHKLLQGLITKSKEILNS
jgi:four helix bundle protein